MHPRDTDMPLFWSTLKKSWQASPIFRKSLSALYWLPIPIIFTKYFYTVKHVTGMSMQPTLNPNSSLGKDIVIFDRLSRCLRCQFVRGDVVALWSPEDPKVLLVKRIIALEGDVVDTLPPYPEAQVRVPRGHVWVEGDEHFHSDDSNRFGPVSLALLDSRLIFILWPFNRFGPLHHKRLANAGSGGHRWRRKSESWRNSRVTQDRCG